MKNIIDIRFGLDIGHGVDTLGKAYADFKEHTFNSNIVIKLLKELKENYGFTDENFILAQQPNSKEVKLYDRYDYYHNIDGYISIHADAHSNHDVNGLSLYYWINSSGGFKMGECFRDAFLESGIDIKFKKLDEADEDPSDGTYDNMGILREPKSFGILIEHGYMTNDHDREEMAKDNIQDKFAEVWAKAIINYLIEMDILDENDIKTEEDDMEERLDLKFIKDGKTIESIEKTSYEKLSGRLDAHRIVEEEKLDDLYVYCGRTLKYGDWKTSDYQDVSEAQIALNEIIVNSVTVDGQYGNEMKIAVSNYQIDKGIFGEGELDETTADSINIDLNAMQDDLDEESVIIPEEEEVPTAGLKNALNLKNVPLSYGDSGNDVREYQIALKLVGFKDIEIDENFGNQCKTFTNQIRKENGLTQTGIADEEVYEILSKKTLSKETIYHKQNGIYFAEIHVDKLHGMKEKVNGYNLKKIIDDDLNYCNATFRWYNATDKKVYAQSPFIADGECYENRTILEYNGQAPYFWLGKPMPIFHITQDGEVGIDIENNPKSQNYEFAVGGINLFPKVSYEGFDEKNKGSLNYTTKRHAILHNPSNNRVIIAYHSYLHLDTFSSRLYGMGYKYGIGLDSGNSTQLKTGNVEKNTSRVMVGWITWED